MTRTTTTCPLGAALATVVAGSACLAAALSACTRPAPESAAERAAEPAAERADGTSLDPAVRAALVDRADAAASDLMRTLVGELMTALGAGAPSDAVDVCSTVAQDLTRAAAARHDVALRRTALRVRNPVNAPDDHERAVLEAWRARWPDDRAADRPGDDVQVVATADGRRELRLVRPIRLMQPCLPCHGPRDAIPPDVLAAIEERYPEDAATGFQDGELRGAESVRVALPEDASSDPAPADPPADRRPQPPSPAGASTSP